ncbi:kinase-like domain-containing protein [Aspergillus bertholletiae]|uniref:non-specific serine/threonine protein kinase n=1 Tax=Aspergillus bertholletiae TaxID=1226010 RepID=A0A5N7BHP6_9EURO|nr:kinase-like domain-containing protein [Aspergillus bertholletiae]
MSLQVTKTNLDIEAEIIKTLSQTQYACSDIKRISGGYINFTYRGHVLCPLSDGSTSVIIKHGEEYSPEIQNISVSTIRCEAEHSMIQRINRTCLQHVVYSNASVRVPHVYQFFPECNTQVMEDFKDSKSLRAALRFLSMSSAASIGQGLGEWLASFHSWARAQGDTGLPTVIRGNSELYDMQVRYICHEILRECESERVSQYCREKLLGLDKEDVGVVHGDFTSRNILIQNFHVKDSQPINLAIVDWEVCHYGNQSRDVAGFIASIYMAHHFDDVDVADRMLQAFIQGYGLLSEEQAFRIVVETGICFFLWHVYTDGKQTEKQVKDLLQLAHCLLVKGCEKDWEWIEHSFLGCLLAGAAGDW